MSAPRAHDLVVSPYTPTLASGRALRTAGIVRALLGHGPVDLLYVPFGADRPDPAIEALPGLTLHRVVPGRGVRRALTYAQQRAIGVPQGFARGASPDLRRAAERLAAAPGRGRVIADGPIAAAVLQRLSGRRPVIYNAHNLESSFRHELKETAGFRHARELRSFERGVLRAAAETWMVSARDLREADELAPGARLRLVPNVVDVEGTAPVPWEDDRTGVLFLGDFTYEPNVNGLRFLVEEAMPAVWRGHPDVTLTVAGKASDTVALEGDDGPRLRRLGFVDDLEALYRAAGCVVVPLIEGGGSPLKFVEALAHALPVVATPRAARGLDVEAGVHFLAASPTRAEFAIAIVEALRGMHSQRIAAEGRALAEREYSVSALTRRLAPGAPLA